MFSCEQAVRNAFTACQLEPDDIDFFGLYDCFPICFVRAVEAVGLAPKSGPAYSELAVLTRLPTVVVAAAPRSCGL